MMIINECKDVELHHATEKRCLYDTRQRHLLFETKTFSFFSSSSSVCFCSLCDVKGRKISNFVLKCEESGKLPILSFFFFPFYGKCKFFSSLWNCTQSKTWSLNPFLIAKNKKWWKFSSHDDEVYETSINFTAIYDVCFYFSLHAQRPSENELVFHFFGVESDSMRVREAIK